MQSFQTQYGRFLKLTNDDSSANTTLGKALLNESEKVVLTKRGGKWWFLEVDKTITTVASQQDYDIPNSIRKIVDLYVLVGTTKYMPRPVEDPDRWKVILSANLGDSDAAQFFYRNGGVVSIQPAPGSAGNTIYLKGRKFVKDRSTDDYTTGTLTATINSKTITGAGTTFTAAMVGRWILLPDGLWYEIAAYTSATVITLVKAFEGATTVGATYTIGEMSVLPESYEDLPLWRAVAIYWTMQRELALAATYWKMYDGGFEAGLQNVTEVGGLLGVMMQEAAEKVEGVYVSPLDDVQIRNPNFPPPDSPASSFT